MLSLLLAFLLELVCSQSVISVVVSNNAGLKFKHLPHIAWKTGSSPSNGMAISLDLSRQHQPYDGIGGSFLRSGSINLNLMPKHVQEEILEKLFHPTKGARFTLGKVPIGGSDAMPPVWYTYNDYPAYDVDLKNFSVAHDETVNGTIPYIQRATKMAGRKILLEATMDYPPWWMLNTTIPLPSADLNTTLFRSLAHYYLKFSQALAARGIPLTYMSMFNERGYCAPSLQNLATLFTEHVGPLFRANQPNAPKITWVELSSRWVTNALTPYFLAFPKVMDYLDLVMYHGYDCGDNFGGWISTGLNTTCPGIEWTMQSMAYFVKHNLPRDMKIWMSELCYAIEYGDYVGPPSTPMLPRADFQDAMQWGYMIFGDFVTVGASGWIYWNMILDTKGGPWLISPEHNDPPINIQQPLIIVDPPKGTYQLTGAYYMMAHFGKYLEPLECVRVGLEASGLSQTSESGLPGNFKFVAFLNPSKKKVVINLMNDDTSTRTAYLNFAGSYAQIDLTPISITTLEFTV